jgi:hypothetical protein
VRNGRNAAMAIQKITAKVECDGCGKSFEIDLDPADTDLKSYLDLAAYVDDHTDVIGDHALCYECGFKVAEKLNDVEDPSYDQVHNVVKIAA